MKEIELKCPNCGATTGATFVAQNVWRCGFCQAQFEIEADAPPQQRVQAPPPPAAWRPRKTGSAKTAWLIMAGSLAVLAGCFVVAAVFSESNTDAEPSPPQHATPATPHSTAPASHLTATFHYDRTVRSSDGYQYVLGEVKNTSKTPIAAAKVYVLMQNAQGHAIASKTSFTDQDVIEPGMTVPFEAILSKPPHYAKLAFDVSASSPFGVKPAQGLRLENIPPRVGSYGQWVFSGKVVNGGTTTARFVRIEVVARDAKGKMLGVDNSYADSETLAPGASCRYEVTSVAYPQHVHPARFQYYVWGDR